MPSVSRCAQVGSLVVIISLISATPATAQATVWQGTTADWFLDANWSMGFPNTTWGPSFASPSATLLATNNDYFGLVTSNLTVTSDAAGPVSISGNAFRLTGIIDVASGKTLTIANGLGFSTENASSFTLTGAGTVIVSGPTAYVNSSGGTLQSGTLNLQTTLNSSNGLSAFTGTTLTGNGTITGGVTTSGTVKAGTGVGASTLTIGGGLVGNNVTLIARLFGTGYTNSTTSDMSKIAVSGTAALTGVAALQLDLSALSATQVSQLRASILAGGSSRDYAILTAGGLTGDGTTQPTILNYGNFLPSEWTFTRVVSGNNVLIRFTPVPEPVATLAVGGALTAFGYRRRFLRRNA